MIRQLNFAVILLGVLLIMGAILAGCAQATPAPADTEAPVASAPTATSPPPPTPTEIPPPTPEPTATSPPEPELTGDPVRGGLLYDKWWEALGIDAPEGDHPLWKTQTTNTRSGTDTWRCKECHGWDYKGVDGAYGSGSHLTGFTGILQSKDKPVSELMAALDGSANPDHDFSALMEEQALVDLVLFMSTEMMDMSEIVSADKVSVGVASDGQEDYEFVCTNCHGPQGNAINFGGIDELEFVGHIGADNPWEFIHKVRFGAPGWPMPSSILNEWSNQQVADVLAFAKDLSMEAAHSSGGLLYDQWWVVVGTDPPAGDQPLWATQTTNTRSGGDTWRCKECHGWDYKGVDGAYGSGSHMTGFKGILDSASLSAEELTAWLTGATNPDHDFTVMGDAAITALVTFIQEEAIDTSALINADGTITSGDAVLGKEMYDNTCASCHGDDGKTLNFGGADDPEYVGTIAVDNPWEFIHKASFGQPGQPMPASVALDWTLEQRMDLLAYAQTLPIR